MIPLPKMTMRSERCRKIRMLASRALVTRSSFIAYRIAIEERPEQERVFCAPLFDDSLSRSGARSGSRSRGEPAPRRAVEGLAKSSRNRAPTAD